jgi:predicted GIY-YIG superfamily endonuclease
VDREVWNEFYSSETGEIDTESLEVEFQRLWGDTHPAKAKVTEGEAGTRKTTYRPGPTPQPGGYSVSASQHEEWFVYVLELSNKKAVKVGMSHDPKARLKHYNHTIMPEITNLSWNLSFFHPFLDAKTAQEVEQTVLRSFAKNQLPSNGEILRNVDAMNVQLAIIGASGSKS